MFIRIEVAVQPQFKDSPVEALTRKIELYDKKLWGKIRWARLLDVYWLDISGSRDELMNGLRNVGWDPVLQWMFTGNWIPAAAGKSGGLRDVMEHAPNRPGYFFGLERRLRTGVTDTKAQVLLEGLEIALGRPLEGARSSSGSLLLLEGPQLSDEDLTRIANQVYCNELIETWTLLDEDSLMKNDRFHQERIRYELPRPMIRKNRGVKHYGLESLDDQALQKMSLEQLWALSLPEMKAIQKHFSDPEERERREHRGMSSNPTDVEMEVLAQTWSEHCKHKIFNAQIQYQEKKSSEENTSLRNLGSEIPSQVDSLFKATIAGATAELKKKWLISVFEDNAGICAFDEDHAFCVKVETHNSPSALDPYGGALTGIVGVNRDILGCGLGAKPILNTNVFCLAAPDHSDVLPERLHHPRRILDGVRQGVEHGGNKSGIPTVNGALCFDPRFIGKPLIFCGSVGWMPKAVQGEPIERKKVEPNDRVMMIGGRIGKDGIHGATFSSLAMNERSPMSAVQLGNPLTQKRMTDFLIEARDRRLYRCVTDNGAGGLSSSVGEMAQLSGGARIDVSQAKVKYPGLKPFELVVSESQERMTLAVPPASKAEFEALARKRGVEVSDLGEFTSSGRFEIYFGEECVADLELDFLHRGVPRLELDAVWEDPHPEWQSASPVWNESERKSEQAEKILSSFQQEAPRVLRVLLGTPNIASKEWLVRQYDHEVQGQSVVKPIHSAKSSSGEWMSGPNDASVVKPNRESSEGLVVGCGLNPRMSDLDPYLMAQAAVDEAIRNVIAVGAEFGHDDAVLALVDNFCWPDPVARKDYAAALVRACYGLKDAVLKLGVPLVSGKDSMKNDYRGTQRGDSIHIAVPPTLLMTALGKISDHSMSKTANFKRSGDVIYLLGPGAFGLASSELRDLLRQPQYEDLQVGDPRIAVPDWEVAYRLYSWMGNPAGRAPLKLRSVHDVSEGGMLVALTESLFVRNLGAHITLPANANPWEFCFGEGFHSFVVSLDAEEGEEFEREWKKAGIPFWPLGITTTEPTLKVKAQTSSAGASDQSLWKVDVSELRRAWNKEGYWE